MTIDIQTESVLPFSKVPAWCAEHLGRPINRSTAHRWRTRGARGVKLETFLAGGSRYTSHEALQRFFDGTTAVADAQQAGSIAPATSSTAITAAEAYLADHGIC